MIFTRIELFWWMVAANLAGRCIYELVYWIIASATSAAPREKGSVSS